MGHTPIDAGDILHYTPESLTNLPEPPVFRLKAGTRRDKERFSHSIMAEGLRYHDPEAFPYFPLVSFNIKSLSVSVTTQPISLQ